MGEATSFSVDTHPRAQQPRARCVRSRWLCCLGLRAAQSFRLIRPREGSFRAACRVFKEPTSTDGHRRPWPARADRGPSGPSHRRTEPLPGMQVAGRKADRQAVEGRRAIRGRVCHLGESSPAALDQQPEGDRRSKKIEPMLAKEAAARQRKHGNTTPEDTQPRIWLSVLRMAMRSSMTNGRRPGR